MNQTTASKRTGTRGVASVAFPSIAWNEMSLSPITNATTAATPIGLVAYTVAAGTATARALATTNVATSMRRLGYVSAGTAGAVASLRGSVATMYRGTAMGLGGFVVRIPIVISDAAAVSGALMFVGLAATTSAIATTTDPTAIVNAVGLAQITGSSDLYMVCNPASGAGRSINLSTWTSDLTSFLATNTSTVFTLELVCTPYNGVHTIKWSVVNEGTGAMAQGEFDNSNSELPAATTALTYHIHRDNNATAAAVGIDFGDVKFWTYGV